MVITFLFRFDICIKHTLSAISHFQKSHLMFELRYKAIFYMIKISYKNMLQQNHFVITKLEKLSILK